MSQSGLFYIRALKDQGYSYDQIAKFAGISKRAAINWYHGDVKPRPVYEEMVRAKLKKTYEKLLKLYVPEGFVLYKKERVTRRKKRVKKSTGKKKGILSKRRQIPAISD